MEKHFSKLQNVNGLFQFKLFPLALHWNYKGKENLFTIDEPHFKIGSNLQPPRIENIVPRQDILVLSDEILEMEIPFDFPNQTPFLRNIFLAVNDILKDANLKINSIKHTSYLEHYSFHKEVKM